MELWTRVSLWHSWQVAGASRALGRLVSQSPVVAVPSVVLRSRRGPRLGLLSLSSACHFGREGGPGLGTVRYHLPQGLPVATSFSVYALFVASRLGWITPPRSIRLRGVYGGGGVVAHLSPGYEGSVLALQSFQEMVTGSRHRDE